MDPAVDDPGSALAGHAAYLIAAQGVAGVDADADDVTGLDGAGIDGFDGFIDEDGVAGKGGGGSGKDEEPAGRDDCGAEGIVAGVHEVNAHGSRPFSQRAEGWFTGACSKR